MAVALTVAWPVRVFAQQIRFGVAGGTNLTRDLHTTNDTYTIPEPDTSNYLLNVLVFSHSRNAIVGPTLEFLLPRRFSVEVDALHRTLQSTQVVTSLFTDGPRQSYTDHFVNAKTWEFPVLLKYVVPVSRLRSFVELGPSFRVLAGSLIPAYSATRVDPVKTLRED